MKTSDISDQDVLRFLAKHQGRWSTWGDSSFMPTVQDAMPAGTPHKLQLSKMKALHRRGFIGGCLCGCRGDFEITDLGLAFIGQLRATPYSGYGHLEGSVTSGLEGQFNLLKKFGYVLQLDKVETKPGS